MLVRDIVRKYLEDNGYDGLRGGDNCCCCLPAIMPENEGGGYCDNCQQCRAGVFVDTAGYGCVSFAIGDKDSPSAIGKDEARETEPEDYLKTYSAFDKDGSGIDWGKVFET